MLRREQRVKSESASQDSHVLHPQLKKNDSASLPQYEAPITRSQNEQQLKFVTDPSKRQPVKKDTVKSRLPHPIQKLSYKPLKNNNNLSLEEA